MSAGMSADLEAAVAAGANVLRVGTALFGTRPPLLRLVCAVVRPFRPPSPPTFPEEPDMPGAMRKLGLYLGLVEDDEDGRHGGYADDDHYGYDEPEPAPTRAYRTDLGRARPAGRRSATRPRPAGPWRSTPPPRPARALMSQPRRCTRTPTASPR